MKTLKQLLLGVALALVAFVPASGYDTNTHTTIPSDVKTVGDLEVGGNDIVDSGDTTRITLGATNTINGNLSVTGNLTGGAIPVYTPGAAQSVAVASNTLTPTAGYQLIGSTGAITLTGVPTIATAGATNGQFLILDSTAAVITLQDKATLTGTALCLSTGTVAITTSTPVSFIFNSTAGCWKQIK